MMPSIEVKSNEVERNNEMQSVINHFIARIDDTMNDDNSIALKNPSEIKSENFCLEKENSNDNSLSTCFKCQNLQKKLKISRGWNRFFKEKLLNYDKLLHIIEKYENEKKKNIELQLAYDQRSREWSHQQEQLIALLHEVQPLREQLMIAEKKCAEETKVRLKHQYMEDGFKVTIQQLQAKVSQMNTIANPIFVENLDKKLKDARSENKKIKCNLAYKNVEVKNCRSYISNKRTQIENLSKKLLWSLQLAIKFGAEESSNREDTLEWKILQKQTHTILQALKSQFDQFCDTKKKELEGRKLEIACLPSFSKWLLDFDSCSMTKQEPLEEDFHHEISKCEEPNLIEEEANQLEKLLSGVDVQEIFVNVNREDLNSSLELASPFSKSPPKSNTKKSQLNIKNELEDCTKNYKIEKSLKNSKTPQLTNSNKVTSEKSPLSNKANIKMEGSDNLNSNKSTLPSRRKRVNRISSVKNDAIASTSSFGDLSSTSAINKNSKFTRRRRLSSSSDMDENRSPVRRSSVCTASKSSIFDISSANSKSPRRRRRLSSMDENQSPVRNSIFNDNKSALSAINRLDLKFKHKRWSSISDMDDDQSPVKSSTFNVNKSVLSAINSTNSKSPRSRLSSKSDINKNKSPVRNSKSPRKRRLSSKSDNEDNRSSVSNAEPSGNDNFNMFKILMNKSLEIPGKRLSSTPVKKLPNIERAKTPTSLMKKSRKIVIENLKNLSDTSSDSDSDNIPLARLKKRHKKTFIDLKRETNNLSNSDVISSMEVVMETPCTSSSSNNNKAEKEKDLERIKQIMNEFTVPPLNLYSPYPEETDSSSNEIVQMLPKKLILIKKENLKKKISLPPVGGANGFVPQRVTRSSYKRKSLPNESKKSSPKKEPKNERHISTPKRKRRKSALSTDTEINSRESSVIFPLSLAHSKEEYSKEQTSETSMVTKSTNQSTPIEVSKESILKCDIEISNSNTNMEEDDKELATDLTEEINDSGIDKNTGLEENVKELTNADLTEEIGNSVIDKSSCIIKSLDKPTALSTEDKSIFDENFINTDIELAYKMEDEESDKNIKQADNHSAQTVKEICDSSSLGLNLSEDSFQEEDEEQGTSNNKSVLSLSQICNDSLKLISPITSPIKNDSHLSTSNDTGILLNQDFGKNQTNVLPENFNIKTPLNITKGLFSKEMSQSLQSVLENEDIVLNKSQLKAEKISGDAIPNNAPQIEHKNLSHLSNVDGISNTPIIEVTGGKSFFPKMAVLAPASNDAKIEDDDGLQVQTKDLMEVSKVEDNGEKYTSKKLPSKLNTLFANELSSQVLLSPVTTTVSKRHPSSSSISMVLSDSSDSIGEDNANITVNFESMEAKLDLTSDEEENSLIMDIDMNLQQIDKRDSDDAGYSNNEYYHNALDVDTKRTSAEFKDINKSSVLMKSTEDNYLNSSQTNESEINLAANSTAVLPSFYKERNESPEQNGFEVPDIFFKELSEDDEKETSQKEKTVKAKKKNKAKKTKQELAQTKVQIKTVKPKVKKVASNEAPICLPQIRNHRDFQTKPSKFQEKEGDSVLLHEYFEDIIGSHLGGQEWNTLCNKICDHLKNTEAPNLISKLQPLTRILLISILRSSPYEKRDTNFALPPTIYKLFQIVRIIEGHFEYPPFTLDSLVNVAAHKLILTRKLRANSLTSLSTWVICSCNAQYNTFKKPQDEECLRWGRGFLTDLLFHHSGLTHESLLTAVNSSKKIFLRIVKYRESTALEKIIYWIAYYGSWNGPKATKTKLLDTLKLKLGLINPPPEQPMDLLKAILLVLIDAEVDDDELASTKTGFLLLLSWVPRSWIIKNIFPLLKDVYYDDFITNKLPLDDLKELLAFMVKRGRWPEEEENLFLNSLTSFPLLKS